MSSLQIVTTLEGRALEYHGEQVALPAMAVDATIHAYQTPSGLWAGAQAAGEPRPVYPGSGGVKLGTIELEADAGTVELKRKADLIATLEPQRKDAEAKGVIINGIRYAGDPSNRQALGEALEYASVSDVTVFSGWKDSDGKFHLNHPVADVRNAYEAIGTRRSALIALEGTYASEIMSGTLVHVDGLSWEVGIETSA